jgi:ATP-dependent helicase/nuclease subunit B
MVKRVFLGWEQPVVDLAADWLLARRGDLPGMCVVVPTTQSGRRLKDRMAEMAGALLSPEFVTPAWLLRTHQGEAAATWQETVAWCEVLENVGDWDEFEGLFPHPPDLVKGEAHDLAQELQGLARRLQDNGHTLASAARMLGSSYDAERWECLARLEGMFRKKLGSWGGTSRSDVLSQRGSECLTHREYVLAGVCDMSQLAARLFAASDKPVTVLIGAPEDRADDFDELGIPLASWSTMPMPWPEEGKGEVLLVTDTRAQAHEALTRVCRQDAASNEVALGTGDPDIAGELARIFGEHGWPAFDPSAIPTPTGLRRWLRVWRAWLRDASFAAFQDLLALPESDFLAAPELRVACLRTLNRQRDKDMLTGVRDLVRFASADKEDLRQLAAIANAAMERRQQFLSQPFGVSMTELLDSMVEHEAEADATAIRAWLEEAASMTGRVERPPGFWLDVLLASLPVPSPSPTEDRVIDVLGWLELPFERGAHLIVCGMNDGKVPAQVPSDPWLGESASKLLGLPTNESRAARDAYLARYLTECRRRNGRVDWICGKTSASGDTMLPSRILLNAEGDELARRVRHLFRDLPPADSGMRWHADWKWQPRQVDHGERIRVTAFKDWLACPFRYYLKHVVGMQKPEPDRIEWNARDYGTIFHQIVEWWGQEEEAREFSKVEALSEWFSQRLDGLVTQRFGKSPTLAIRLQTESLRNRLEWLAHEQAVLRASGWRTIDVERKFELTLGKWTVRGMIDRIDEHPDFGQRVIDYKTSASLGKVGSEHCSKVTANARLLEHWGEDSPVFFTMEEKGKPQTLRWTNLQLPLYAAAIRERTGTLPTPCYIGVGTSRDKVKVDPWEEFSEAHMESAWKCAEWIGGQIAGCVFWPPAEKVAYPNDEVAALSCGRAVTEMFEKGEEGSTKLSI